MIDWLAKSSLLKCHDYRGDFKVPRERLMAPTIYAATQPVRHQSLYSLNNSPAFYAVAIINGRRDISLPSIRHWKLVASNAFLLCDEKRVYSPAFVVVESEAASASEAGGGMSCCCTRVYCGGCRMAGCMWHYVAVPKAVADDHS